MKVLLGCVLMTVSAFEKFITDEQNAMNPPYEIFDASCFDASTFQSGSNRELSETFTYLFVTNCSNFHITRTVMGVDILLWGLLSQKFMGVRFRAMGKRGKAIEENTHEYCLTHHPKTLAVIDGCS